ncbi:RNA polymerase Rpc34 [Microdochium trichocladiopsis]|uniref:DNA-directed RNA polymerase III subunit RPC6 n=1 Tax=Microdochium trichocladiopsis TaxID=1682393 RepID=A0A9P8YCU8_9PEZI|nr:RNA polymerase Rpc34 [Microdochium trichocladiopsis]KAH7034586.1 RNA polymerase Rpc34 [Microdochium trichocladiopsis]
MAATSLRGSEELSLLKTQLYTACEEAFGADYDKPMTQDDLFGLEVVPPKDIKKLMEVITALTHERLLVPVNLHSGLAWKLRAEAEAAKYKLLTSQEQSLVYELIDNAGADGAWQQDMKKKLNIQENTLKKVLKELESRRLIRQVTDVANISKKIWIKYNLKQSAKSTGGPFYTDSTLDEGFIEALMGLIMELARQKGSYLSSGSGGADRRRSTSPVLPKKGVINGHMSEAALRSKKRSADAITKDEPGTTTTNGATNNISSAPLVMKPRKSTVRLPLPAGYIDYITAEEICDEANHIAKGQPLEPKDIQQLLDVLMWDGRIEQVKIGDRIGYRAVRVAKQNPDRVPLDAPDFWEKQTNGLTTAPCGRCPVFELCEEGGPVWAGGCEYFDQWLA